MIVACKQLGMRALFHDAPLLEHHDLIRSLDGAEAVSDDQRRAAFEQLAHALLHQHLGQRVDVRCRLVHDQDARIGQEECQSFT